MVCLCAHGRLSFSTRWPRSQHADPENNNGSTHLNITLDAALNWCILSCRCGTVVVLREGERNILPVNLALADRSKLKTLKSVSLVKSSKHSRTHKHNSDFKLPLPLTNFNYLINPQSASSWLIGKTSRTDLSVWQGNHKEGRTSRKRQWKGRTHYAHYGWLIDDGCDSRLQSYTRQTQCLKWVIPAESVVFEPSRNNMAADWHHSWLVMWVRRTDFFSSSYNLTF